MTLTPGIVTLINTDNTIRQSETMHTFTITEFILLVIYIGRKLGPLHMHCMHCSVSQDITVAKAMFSSYNLTLSLNLLDF